MATDLRPSLPIINHKPRPYDGPSRDEVLALRHQYLSPGIITYYRDPLMIVEGHMQYVWDEKGRRYLDAFAGIVTISVGHCHPKVVERVREQTGKLQHTTTIYLHPAIVQFVLVDGSVHSIPRTVDTVVYSRLANRNDGNVVALP